MAYSVIIPARYASSRLPGKPLLMLAGQPMIQWVWQLAHQSDAQRVIIATDDERIQTAAQAFGAEVVMTRSDHLSGTDRLQEVVAQAGFDDDDIVVNVQGDEPLLPTLLIRQVADNLAAHPEASIATLCEPIDDVDAVFNPNIVKVTMDINGLALTFSRSPMPWSRDHFQPGQTPNKLPGGALFNRHIGLYAYRVGFLHRYVSWAPAPIEQCEQLEQLRALWQGERIHVAQAAQPHPHGVDTEADARRVETLLLNPVG